MSTGNRSNLVMNSLIHGFEGMEQGMTHRGL